MPRNWNPKGSLIIPDDGKVERAQDISLSAISYKKAYSERLFTEVPSSRHINQRLIGDCWILSVVISILNFNVQANGEPIDKNLLTGPEIILGMMVEDPKDKKRVVVRLYDKEVARYISVKKSFPILSGGLLSIPVPVLSEGALWVKLLEKAIAILRGGESYKNLEPSELERQELAFRYLLGVPKEESDRTSEIKTGDFSHSGTDQDDFLLLMSTRGDLKRLIKEKVIDDKTVERIIQRFLKDKGTLDEHPWWNRFNSEVSNAWLSLLAKKGAPTWDRKGDRLHRFLQGEGPNKCEVLTEVLNGLRGSEEITVIPIHKWEFMSYIAADLKADKEKRKWVQKEIFAGNQDHYDKWIAWYTQEQREIWWRGQWWVKDLLFKSSNKFAKAFLGNATMCGFRWLKIEDVERILKDYKLPRRDKVISALESKQLLPRKRGAGTYSKRQEDMFKVMYDTLYAEKRCVTGGTDDYVGKSDEELPAKKVTGLVGRHGYAILAVSAAHGIPDSERPSGAKDGACFIKVRNPWGELYFKAKIRGEKVTQPPYGRGYNEKDRGDGTKVLTPVEVETPEFWIELNDLDKRFTFITKGPVMSTTPAYQETQATLDT